MWYSIALCFMKSLLSSRRRCRSHHVHQLCPCRREHHHSFRHVRRGPPLHCRSSPCIYLLLCLELINSSGMQAVIKWQSYDSSHHAVPRLAGREKILHHRTSHTNTLQILKLYHITCTLCKNKLDRHLDELLQILSWLLIRLTCKRFEP